MSTNQEAFPSGAGNESIHNTYQTISAFTPSEAEYGRDLTNYFARQALYRYRQENQQDQNIDNDGSVEQDGTPLSALQRNMIRLTAIAFNPRLTEEQIIFLETGVQTMIASLGEQEGNQGTGLQLQMPVEIEKQRSIFTSRMIGMRHTPTAQETAVVLNMLDAYING